MIIGNIPKNNEKAIPLNKWIIGVEILKHSPYKCFYGFAFKPHFLFVCEKTIDFGTQHVEVNGRPAKRVGGWWRFEFPFGINIAII